MRFDSPQIIESKLKLFESITILKDYGTYLHAWLLFVYSFAAGVWIVHRQIF